MSKKIQTYNDLVEEKQRLETLLGVQKQQMKTSWEQLLLELTPVQSIFGHVKKFFKADKSNPAVNFAVGMASDTLLKKILLARADWVTRLVVPLFVKNYSSNFLNNDKTKRVFSKVAALFKRGPAKTKQRDFDRNGTYSTGRPAYSTPPATTVAPVRDTPIPESRP